MPPTRKLSAMRGPRSTEGATLVVVVLLTMLLLAALLAASSQLTLSSRRTVADQRAALQAQYVAESGVALAQSRLRDVQTILTKGNLVIPYGTTATTIRSYAEKYCGNSNWVGNSDKQTCTAQISSADDQFEVFAQFVSDAAYSRLPAAERPTDLAAKRAFWKNQLGPLQQLQANGATINYRLVPTRVERLNNSSYRFYLQLDNLSVKGDRAAATRVLKASRTKLSGWWIDISLPSYLDNVLFTNHHRSLAAQNSSTATPDVYFTNQTFDGPVHTNEYYLFTSGATASFAGRLSSAGCTNLPKVGQPSSGSCSQRPGVYVGSTSGLKTASANATTEEQKNNSILQQLMAGASPNLADVTRDDGSQVKDVTFTADYRPMPNNANSQRAAAQGFTPPTSVTTDPEEVARYTSGRGLYFGDEVLGITLTAGDANGNPPTSVSGDPKKWTPAPTYQYIQVLKGYILNIPQYDYYRADANGKLEEKDALGNWKVVPDPESPSKPRPFNGTIFAEKTIHNLSGPARSGNQAVRPALAPFSQITVASESGDVEISGDLTLSDESCTKDLNACTDNGIEPPKNVLGVFTQKGNVVITGDAPNNVNIQAVLMSSEGQVTVDNYDDRRRGPRGAVNLVGGLVENWYGPFGTFSGSTSLSGYGRNFLYDRRFQNPGFTPPFFPVSPTWVKKDGSDEGLSLENFVVQQGTRADLP